MHTGDGSVLMSFTSITQDVSNPKTQGVLNPKTQEVACVLFRDLFTSPGGGGGSSQDECRPRESAGAWTMSARSG